MFKGGHRWAHDGPPPQLEAPNCAGIHLFAQLEGLPAKASHLGMPENVAKSSACKAHRCKSDCSISEGIQRFPANKTHGFPARGNSKQADIFDTLPRCCLVSCKAVSTFAKPLQCVALAKRKPRAGCTCIPRVLRVHGTKLVCGHRIAREICC